MFHFHKLGKVQEDGYQYCLKCGKAFVPPCIHQFETIDKIPYYEMQFLNQVLMGYKYVKQCKKCKVLREFDAVHENYYQKLMKR